MSKENSLWLHIRTPTEIKKFYKREAELNPNNKTNNLSFEINRILINEKAKREKERKQQ